jgi:hypothetical protein
MRLIRSVASLALAVLLPVAASGAEKLDRRAHPDLAARLSGLRKVGIIEPDVKVYELTASNQAVYRPDWSDEGRKAVASSLDALLRARGLEARPFAPTTPDAQQELLEVTRLYHAVTAAVVQATFVNQFPAKVARFEYSLGDLGPLLEAEQLDAVVFTIGSGAVSSGGRKAVQFMSALLSGASSSGVDRLIVGVVDRRGDLLWFGSLASTSYDLRDPAIAGQFVQRLGSDLPAVKR